AAATSVSQRPANNGQTAAAASISPRTCQGENSPQAPTSSSVATNASSNHEPVSSAWTCGTPGNSKLVAGGTSRTRSPVAAGSPVGPASMNVVANRGESSCATPGSTA